MTGTAGAVRCSVVVPVRDGAATLGRQLRALATQVAPVRFEVVVADNGSTDGTVQVAAAYAPLVRVVDASHGVGVNVARTAGIRASVGELVLLCDADDLVHPGWLAAHWAAYEAGAVLLGGSLRHVTVDGRELGRQHRLNDDLRFLPWPTGANCGFARSVHDEVGGFDPALRGGADETDFFWRAQLAGHPLVLVDDAVVDYVARPTLVGAFRQYVGYGLSHVLLFRRYAAAGMPRARTFLRLATMTRLVGHVVGTEERRGPLAVVRFAGMLLGRAIGSVRERRLYL